MKKILAPLSRRSALGGLIALPAFLSRATADEPTIARPSRARGADCFRGSGALVMDFEALARDALPPAHFGYIATGMMTIARWQQP